MAPWFGQEGSPTAAGPTTGRNSGSISTQGGRLPGPHEKIHWPDFGVPDNDAQAARQIRAAFECAKAGQHVEVGCKGGLGRTGTVLACMPLLAGVGPEDAIAWVRKNYHRNAVECRKQEDWMRWFAYGSGELPPEESLAETR